MTKIGMKVEGKKLNSILGQNCYYSSLILGLVTDGKFNSKYKTTFHCADPKWKLEEVYKDEWGQDEGDAGGLTVTSNKPG